MKGRENEARILRLKYCCNNMDHLIGVLRCVVKEWDPEAPLYVIAASAAGVEEFDFSYCPFCGKRLEVGGDSGE